MRYIALLSMLLWACINPVSNLEISNFDQNDEAFHEIGSYSMSKSDLNHLSMSKLKHRHLKRQIPTNHADHQA
jgi:hypothetical protein